MSELLARIQRALGAARHRRRARKLMHWGRRVEAVVELAQTVDGTLSPPEISLLYRVAKQAAAAGPLVQVGVGRGRGTSVLAMALEDGAAEGALFAIDPRTDGANDFDALRESLQRLRLQARVEVLRAGPERGAAALTARGARLGLLYLEDLGRYEAVAECLALFAPLVGDRGLVLLRGEAAAGAESEARLAFQDALGERADVRERVGGLLVSRLRSAPRSPLPERGL